MTDQRGESRKTVLVAISANAAIAAAKGVGGLLSGSSALLAEAAHSAADACNQGLMLLSLHRSERAPDEEHPFGYGKERFFWVLLAAIFIFLAGGIFGIAEGLFRILAGAAEKGGYAVTYGVLGFALLAEGTSFARALRQTRRGAREARLPFAAYIRASKEPAAKTVVSEDAADVAGILIAFAGTAAAQLTGNELWDGVAAVAIGLLLCVVGWALARDAKGLLIGEPARHEERQRLRRTILEHGAVEDVLDLRTMYLGPQSLLVVARVDLRDELDGAAVERAAAEIDEALREELPDVTEVFLDPT
ncbi:MAG TPA: cation diffusion facilitator family transporter, partial [Gaiellaceae bacterium]